MDRLIIEKISIARTSWPPARQRYIKERVVMFYNQFEEKKKFFKKLALGFIAMMFLVNGMVYKVQYEKQQLQQQLAEKVIRFHVLANSDGAEDQQLKLSVRDAIGSYMQEELLQVEDKAACEKLIEERLEEIEQVAESVITSAGYSYEVAACLTECEFPVKTYGEYTFPAGNYEALRVTIGEGKGANWWCVMYPNMCFENSMYEVVDENAKKALREVLDEEEYEAVFASGKYEIRFRFLEWFR